MPKTLRQTKKKKNKNKNFANVKSQKMPLDHTPQLPSLGDSALLEGKTLGKSEKAGMTIRYEVARCSCQGENENCFKCDGTGYYRREVVEQYRHMDENKLRGQSYFNQRNSNGEYRFSNDQRGGEYGIREVGRFSSNPLHDDHDS